MSKIAAYWISLEMPTFSVFKYNHTAIFVILHTLSWLFFQNIAKHSSYADSKYPEVIWSD